MHLCILKCNFGGSTCFFRATSIINKKYIMILLSIIDLKCVTHLILQNNLQFSVVKLYFKIVSSLGMGGFGPK